MDCWTCSKPMVYVENKTPAGDFSRWECHNPKCKTKGKERKEMKCDLCGKPIVGPVNTIVEDWSKLAKVQMAPVSYAICQKCYDEYPKENS